MRSSIRKLVQRRPYAVFTAVAAVVLLALYFRIFSFGYYSDDFDNIPGAQKSFSQVVLLTLEDDNPIPQYFFRPVGWVTFWVVDKAGLESPAVHYGINLALHLANSVLLFLLILQFFPEPSYKQLLAAMLAVLLFTAGHIAAYTVTWVAQRFDLLALGFSLSALHFAGRYWSGKSLWYAVLSACSFLLALLSKEIAFILPAILIIWFVLVRSQFSDREFSIPRLVMTAAMFGALAFIILPLRAAVGVASSTMYPKLLSIKSVVVSFALSVFELLQPYRVITFYNLFGEGTTPQLILIPALSIVFIVLWKVLFWKAFRGALLSGAAIIGGVIIASCAIFGFMGWVHPRLDYLPAAFLVLALAVPLVGTASEAARSVFIILCVFIALQFGSAWAVTSYYSRVHEGNKRMLYSRNNIPDEYTVIGREFNRQWHMRNGGTLFGAMYSEADPMYEAVWQCGSEPPFLAAWENPRALTLTNHRPNRFFQIQTPEGWTNIAPKNEVFSFSGYRIRVARTARGNRPQDLIVEFDSSWLQQHRLFIDNGRTFEQINRKEERTSPVQSPE
ncbi:MAG: hypothetical protein CL946_12930 [Ectothiorhodospiraceae bacterium]|nr:hypothetical protein [Ectothiorhodospiraceae bacterium]